MEKGTLVKIRTVYACNCGNWTDVTDLQGPWKPSCVMPPSARAIHKTCPVCAERLAEYVHHTGRLMGTAKQDRRGL